MTNLRTRIESAIEERRRSVASESELKQKNEADFKAFCSAIVKDCIALKIQRSQDEHPFIVREVSPGCFSLVGKMQNGNKWLIKLVRFTQREDIFQMDLREVGQNHRFADGKSECWFTAGSPRIPELKQALENQLVDFAGT